MCVLIKIRPFLYFPAGLCGILLVFSCRSCLTKILPSTEIPEQAFRKYQHQRRRPGRSIFLLKHKHLQPSHEKSDGWGLPAHTVAAHTYPILHLCVAKRGQTAL